MLLQFATGTNAPSVVHKSPCLSREAYPEIRIIKAVKAGAAASCCGALQSRSSTCVTRYYGTKLLSSQINLWSAL